MSEPQSPRRRPAVNIAPIVWVPALILLVAAFAGQLWLRGQAGWPQQFGWSCRSGCYFEELWFSPRLLGHGLAADTLFVSLWVAPALAIVTFAIVPLVRRRAA